MFHANRPGFNVRTYVSTIEITQGTKHIRLDSENALYIKDNKWTRIQYQNCSAQYKTISQSKNIFIHIIYACYSCYCPFLYIKFFIVCLQNITYLSDSYDQCNRFGIDTCTSIHQSQHTCHYYDMAVDFDHIDQPVHLKCSTHK